MSMQLNDTKNRRIPAEWETQSFVQLTWPHTNTDWIDYLEDANLCFSNIAKAITKHQNLLIVCNDINNVKKHINDADFSKIHFFEMDTNDTWARDHGGITVLENNKKLLLDFKFNGWGNKFAWEKDNAITQQIASIPLLSQYKYTNCLSFILEGGSIESNGKGTLMTTEPCLLNKNRNVDLSKSDIEIYLNEKFGTQKILWLKNGYLAGDDTDSHIDTLARFISEDTIAYVKCNDTNDEHFQALSEMEKELQNFTTLDGKSFNLVALPMCTPVFDQDNERIPATYANFLFINNAILLPVYNIETDSEAISIFKNLFPDKEIIPIDCSVLIKQHGSLHCVTMQYY